MGGGFELTIWGRGPCLGALFAVAPYPIPGEGCACAHPGLRIGGEGVATRSFGSVRSYPCPKTKSGWREECVCALRWGREWGGAWGR